MDGMNNGAIIGKNNDIDGFMIPTMDKCFWYLSHILHK